jgi:SHS2 domain-containing protein
MKKEAAQRFEEMDHVADAALRVYGHDWEELLANAAYGMFSLIAEWEDVPPSTQHEMSLEAMDGETLLVDWLSELLYRHEMDGVVYTSFDILEASPVKLRAVARGTKQWKPKTAIKAATFSNLHIKRTSQGYTATIVFDT